jgi:D-arginine dehydrogenase
MLPPYTKPVARCDIAIIGAGMAGASLAAEIGGDADVLLIEAEAQPGYHSTGRSAAFWSETYGGPAVQPLTSASGDWLRRGGFLGPRGALHLAAAGEGVALDRLAAEFAGRGIMLERMERASIATILPGIRSGFDDALAEPSCADIDVAALHAHYLGAARRAGGRLLCDARVVGIERAGPGWRLTTEGGHVEASVIVNAAGAWASEIAALAGAMPIAITPYRRTVVQLLVEPAASAELPLVIDAAGQYYFKPEPGGRIWLSPHDETPAIASDVAPDDYDVALAIDRLEQVVDWKIVKKEKAWAGLRSFSPDRAPVYGPDCRASGFFWFAGQGGFGIQTAPAAAMIGAAMLLARGLPPAVSIIDIDRYTPSRFRTKSSGHFTNRRIT